jgi:plasmid stabilization system protein ParE
VTRYLVTPAAERDIDVIRDYLLDQGGTRLVRHVLGHLRRGMDFPGRMPGAGHLREDLTDEPVKFWQVFSYLIVYDPVPRPVHILRVLHSSHDVEAVLATTKR